MVIQQAMPRTPRRMRSAKNVAFLRSTLLNIYATVKREKITLPSELVVPAMQTRKLISLGEPTLQHVDIQKGEIVEVEELERLAAERIVAPRAARNASARSTKMPEINAELIGKRIEAAWDLTYNLANGSSATGLFWCPGIVEAVSDDTTRVDGKKIGNGWMFIAYDDGETCWSLASDRWRWDSCKSGSLRFEADDDGDVLDDNKEDDDEFADAVDATNDDDFSDGD